MKFLKNISKYSALHFLWLGLGIMFLTQADTTNALVCLAIGTMYHLKNSEG